MNERREQSARNLKWTRPLFEGGVRDGLSPDYLRDAIHMATEHGPLSDSELETLVTKINEAARLKRLLANHVGRPWMRALELQFAALRVADRFTIGKSVGLVPDMVGALVQAERAATRCLPQAATYAWSKETTAAIWLASKTVPEDAVFHADLITDTLPAWWWFEWPLPIPMTHNVNATDVDTMHIEALLLRRVVATHEAGLLVTDFRGSAFGPCLTSFFIAPDRTSLGAILKGHAVHPDQLAIDGIPLDPTALKPTSARVAALCRFILAAATWLKQRIIVTSSGTVERHRRKQLAREHNAPLPSDVKIVQLRRTETQSHTSTGPGESVDWSCRWVVNGHWRNQVYKDTHRLIYIMPFVKGPPDKPLRLPTHTVYQVNR